MRAAAISLSLIAFVAVPILAIPVRVRTSLVPRQPVFTPSTISSDHDGRVERLRLVSRNHDDEIQPALPVFDVPVVYVSEPLTPAQFTPEHVQTWLDIMIKFGSLNRHEQAVLLTTLQGFAASSVEEQVRISASLQYEWGQLFEYNPENLPQDPAISMEDGSTGTSTDLEILPEEPVVEDISDIGGFYDEDDLPVEEQAEEVAEPVEPIAEHIPETPQMTR